MSNTCARNALAPPAPAHGTEPQRYQRRQANPFQMYKAKLKMDDVESVGNYTIKILWNDGHNTGIYSYDHFRPHLRMPRKPTKTFTLTRRGMSGGLLRPQTNPYTLIFSMPWRPLTVYSPRLRPESHLSHRPLDPPQPSLLSCLCRPLRQALRGHLRYGRRPS